MRRSRWGSAFGGRPAPPGFTGPLGLLAAGLGLGLLAAPGPWPDLLTWTSAALALFVYAAARHLTRAGGAERVVAFVVGVALGLAVLAFGPSPLADRKVTAFNAWAYQLGTALPPWIAPPPHPNAVAGLLAVALGLTGGLARGGPAARWARPATLALAAALLLTASRAGWLAGAAAVLVLAGAERPQVRRFGGALLGLAGVGLALVVVTAPAPVAGVGPLLSTYSLTVRGQQWVQTGALLSAHPLVGLGLARFPVAYAAAVGPGPRAYTTPANTLLQVWADAGLAGVAALVWISGRAIRLLRGPASGPAPAGLRAGLAAALAALAVDGLFEAVPAIVWRQGAGYGYLTSPLPFLLLGLLAGSTVAAGGATGRPLPWPGRRGAQGAAPPEAPRLGAGAGRAPSRRAPLRVFRARTRKRRSGLGARRDTAPVVRSRPGQAARPGRY